MKKLFIVIGLKIGEVIGGLLLFVALPYITGSYIVPLISKHPESVGWVWFFGFALIALIAIALWLVYVIAMYAIPAWIISNRRWASKLIGESKAYCHHCTEKSEGKKPVHHSPPICKHKT